MLTLLQQQQRLHQLVTETGRCNCRRGRNRLDPVVNRQKSSKVMFQRSLSSGDSSSPSPLGSDSTCTWDKVTQNRDQQNSSTISTSLPGPSSFLSPSDSEPVNLQSLFDTSSWLRTFERRLTTQIRRTIRQEIRKVLSTSRSTKRNYKSAGY